MTDKLIFDAIRHTEERLGRACESLRNVDLLTATTDDLAKLHRDAVHEICNACQNMESLERLLRRR